MWFGPQTLDNRQGPKNQGSGHNRREQHGFFGVGEAMGSFRWQVGTYLSALKVLPCDAIALVTEDSPPPPNLIEA